MIPHTSRFWDISKDSGWIRFRTNGQDGGAGDADDGDNFLDEEVTNWPTTMKNGSVAKILSKVENHYVQLP